jgi:hypothetical protein
MALTAKIATVSMISVHEEDDGVFYDVPNVFPGKFWIPPITAPQQTLILRCKTAVRTLGSTAPERFQYAHIKVTTENPPRKYILLTIPEATTFRYGTEKQLLDEYNQKMFPDIERAPLYVKPEHVANDIERAFGRMGVIAIASYDGEASATQKELKRSRDLYQTWMIRRINETNRNYARHGFAEVTKQTLNIVNRLYRDHLIPALPSWASINPDIGSSSGQLSCPNCHQVVLPGTAQCKCGVVINWALALEYGLKTEAEVPKNKRQEAGLEGPVTTPSTAVPVPVVGTLPDNAVVAIVEKGAGIRTISASDVPLDMSEQSFGGEQIRGTNADQDQVVEEIAEMDDTPEPVSAGRGPKAVRRGGR